MKNIITILSSITIGMLLLSSCGNKDYIPKDNAIKLGTAEVVVKIVNLTDKDSVSLHKISNISIPEHLDRSTQLDLNKIDIIAVCQSIFEFDTYDNIPLTREIGKDGNIVFRGNVPLECLFEICMVGLSYEGAQFNGISVILNQNKLTNIEYYFKDGKFMYANIIDENQPSTVDWWNVYDVMLNAYSMFSYLFAPTDKALYDVSWQEVRKNQYEKVFPRMMEKVQSDCSIPESAKKWLINNLKWRFAISAILQYTYVAKEVTDKDYAEPPMEAYSYLDSIDYSPDVFLMKTVIISPRIFLNSLLKYPCGGFEAIRETPVKEWKEKLSEWLAPAMKERPKLLLDLLAGTSYYQQIEENQPLSDVQKRNIEEGFTDDIGKIVLKRNEKLEEALSQKVNLQDLSEQTFSLQEFIDSKYPGKPVVVDMWNTWCGPCLQAMKQTEDIKGDYADSDLVFLYVSDTSSNEKEWENRARLTGGEQVRINEESKNALMDKYSLDGFPSYLFFDKGHKLIHAQTAFPGLDRYRVLLDQITGK